MVDVDAYARVVSHPFDSEHEAFEHYLSAGAAAATELFPFLDSEYYFSQTGKGATAATTAFEHYFEIGAAADIAPIALFDSDWVRRASEGSLPFRDILDYLSSPLSAEIDPHPLFSRRYYLALNVDVALAHVDPYWHFLHYGWKERRGFHPFFRAQQYVQFGLSEACGKAEFNERIAAAWLNPELNHDQQLFDGSLYCGHTAPVDVAAAPLQHFLTTGWMKSGTPHRLFDAQYYLGQEPRLSGSSNAYVEYLSDFSHTRAPSALFDSAFYLESVGAIGDFQGSLLEHFVVAGCTRAIRPHPRLIVADGYPSRYSGLNPVAGFKGPEGRRYWLAEFDDRKTIEDALRDGREIDKTIPVDYLETCDLGQYRRGFKMQQDSTRAAVGLCGAVARCHCLVVGVESPDERELRILWDPGLQLVSGQRPWLTLLSTAAPALHYLNAATGSGYGPQLDWPTGFVLDTRLLAQVILRAMPNALVVQADAIGLALLREHGRQLSRVTKELYLLIKAMPHEESSMQWLRECFWTADPPLSGVICSSEEVLATMQELGLGRAENLPRLFWMGE